MRFKSNLDTKEYPLKKILIKKNTKLELKWKNMSGLSNLLDYLKKGKKREEVPQGYCPNCWGRLEYGGEFYKAIRKEEIDLNNIEKHKGWIQALAGQYLYGIELKKKGAKWECEQCSTQYENE